MIFSDSYPYGVKGEATDAFQVADRLARICVEATEAQVDSLLDIMGVDYAGMEFDGKRRMAVYEIEKFMEESLGYGTLDWQLDDTIYDYQILEFRKMYLTGTDYIPLSAEYFFWESQFNMVKDEADAVASGFGYGYSISGSLLEKSLGEICGMVAGLANAHERVILTGTFPSTASEFKARTAVVVKEAVSGRLENNPSSQSHSLNMSGFWDRPFMPYNVLSEFDWEQDSIYDYVMFLNESGTYVNFSTLTPAETAMYMANGGFATLMKADAMIKMKEGSGLHVKTWAYRRKLDAIREKLAQYKIYIGLLRNL